MQNNVRRLLLVAYHFSPEPAAGALRPSFLASYLHDFGWETTVLTRPLGDAELPRVFAAQELGAELTESVRARLNGDPRANGTSAVSSLRTFLRNAKEAVLFPDRAAPWIPPAIARGLHLTRRGDFDAVLSTARPVSAHLVGAAIARLRGLPWIADYRDLWSGNPTAARGAARTNLEAALERQLLRAASAITTISAPLADYLETFHDRRVAVIPNGYDPRERAGTESIVPRGFELCFTGSLYDGYRTPELLFAAMAELRKAGDPAGAPRVVFYGPNSGHVGELARRYGVEALVEQRGVVRRELALLAQRQASNNVVLLNMDERTGHELGSKILEYASARRPVLAFGPRTSVMREFVAKHALGWFASSVDEAVEALRQAHRRFSAGDVDLYLDSEIAFDARDLAKAFAALLEECIGDRRSSPSVAVV